MYRRLFASSPNASVDSRTVNVADEAGSRSWNGRRRHHESNSSPRNPPGSSMLVATMPLLSFWLLLTLPRTMNTILWTGSPSLMICAQQRRTCYRNLHPNLGRKFMHNDVTVTFFVIVNYMFSRLLTDVTCPIRLQSYHFKLNTARISKHKLYLHRITLVVISAKFIPFHL